MFEKRSRGYKTIGYSIEAETLDSYPDSNALLDATGL
jgi:hypothetical protein